MKIPVCRVDVAIVGGGIAGLWLLARLQDQGYHAMLVETRALGAGQTLAAQGIIHGGIKYALNGTLSGASEAIAAMPERWRRCLAGAGDVDLGAAAQLAGHQYLITGTGAGRLAGFLASRALRSRVQRLAAADRPAVLRDPGFRGTVYRLDEPVLATASVVAALAAGPPEALALSHSVSLTATGELQLATVGGRRLTLQARRVVLAAGAGNAVLGTVPMQRRPLHMVLLRAPRLPSLYGHFLGLGDKPRLTVTSHRDHAGRAVWYLGGELAETGIARESPVQIAHARHELTALLPWLDLTGAEFATLRIARAEGCMPGGRRPDGPVLVQQEAVMTAWPTKLALTPLLADAIMGRLHTQGVGPGRGDPLPADWPRPALAEYPWNQAGLAWT